MNKTFVFILWTKKPPGSHNRTSKFIYGEMTENVEKWSKIIFVALVKITVPATMLPVFVATVIKYITSESRDDVYRLPFPAL